MKKYIRKSGRYKTVALLNQGTLTINYEAQYPRKDVIVRHKRVVENFDPNKVPMRSLLVMDKFLNSKYKALWG